MKHEKDYILAPGLVPQHLKEKIFAEIEKQGGFSNKVPFGIGFTDDNTDYSPELKTYAKWRTNFDTVVPNMPIIIKMQNNNLYAVIPYKSEWRNQMLYRNYATGTPFKGVSAEMYGWAYEEDVRDEFKGLIGSL